MIGTSVGVLMGSESDYEVMKEAAVVLKEFKVTFEVRVLSAHHCADVVAEFASNAKKDGFKVLIAGAGSAGQLAGAVAAHTTLPVIGVPISDSSLSGFDSLLSTAQMPAGTPVATMAVGKSGARNAGILAAQIIAHTNDELSAALDEFKKHMKNDVLDKDKILQKKMFDEGFR